MYNPTMLCKWNKSLVYCWVFIMSQRSNIAEVIIKLLFDMLKIQESRISRDALFQLSILKGIITTNLFFYVHVVVNRSSIGGVYALQDLMETT